MVQRIVRIAAFAFMLGIVNDLYEPGIITVAGVFISILNTVGVFVWIGGVLRGIAYITQDKVRQLYQHLINWSLFQVTDDWHSSTGLACLPRRFPLTESALINSNDHLSQLPKEMMLSLLQFLRLIDILNLSRTSKTWSRVCSSDDALKIQMQESWPKAMWQLTGINPLITAMQATPIRLSQKAKYYNLLHLNLSFRSRDIYHHSLASIIVLPIMKDHSFQWLIDANESKVLIFSYLYRYHDQNQDLIETRQADALLSSQDRMGKWKVEYIRCASNLPDIGFEEPFLNQDHVLISEYIARLFRGETCGRLQHDSNGSIIEGARMIAGNDGIEYSVVELSSISSRRQDRSDLSSEE